MQRTILFAKTYGILVVTVLLFVVLALTTEGFFTDRNMRNILDQQSGVLIAACFMAMAIIAGTGPPPSTKIRISAMTISGTARMMSITRRKSPMSRGQRASPRVESSESPIAPNAPSKVETAAMFTVSSSAGK